MSSRKNKEQQLYAYKENDEREHNATGNGLESKVMKTMEVLKLNSMSHFSWTSRSKPFGCGIGVNGV